MAEDRYLETVLKEVEEWFDKWSRGVLGRHTWEVANVATKKSATNAVKAIVRMATDRPRSKNKDFGGVMRGPEGRRACAADVGDVSKPGRRDAYLHRR